MAKRKMTRQTIRYLMRKRQRELDEASRLVIEWTGGKHVIVVRPWSRFYLLNHLHQKIDNAIIHFIGNRRREEYKVIRRIFADLPKYQKPRLP